MSNKSYKHIVILSGKGGTGKTTFAASFAKLIRNKIVIDCDVDAANLHLILDHSVKSKHEFYSGKKASIDSSKCTHCGLCENICRFDAIQTFEIDQIKCEGCGFCYRVCPENAIEFNVNNSGSFYEAELTDGSQFVFARLNPGEGNSGKLVSEIKKHALENNRDAINFVLVDGPPGIGCPVNASLADADYVVIVTEPTLSGIHDLKRLVELLKTFKLNCGIIVNKHDLNLDITGRIFDLARQEEIFIIGLIPFEPEFVNSLIKGKSAVEDNPLIKEKIMNIWKQIELQLKISIN